MPKTSQTKSAAAATTVVAPKASRNLLVPGHQPLGADGAPLNVVPDNATAIAKAQKALTVAFRSLTKPLADVNDAETALEQERTKLANSREALLTGIAKTAAEANWSADVIADAVTKAVDAWKAASNDAKTEATISQFALECKKVMHPAARGNVAKAFAIAKREWDAERDEVRDAEGDDKPKTPLLDRFKKRYHMGLRMVDAMLPKTGKKGVVTQNPLASVALDPHKLAEAIDAQAGGAGAANRIASRIKRIREELAGIFADFPVSRIEDAIDELEAVNADALKAAAERRAAQAARDARKAQRAAPQPVVEDDDDDDDDDTTVVAPAANPDGVTAQARAARARQAARKARSGSKASTASAKDVGEAADDLLDDDAE